MNVTAVTFARQIRCVSIVLVHSHVFATLVLLVVDLIVQVVIACTISFKKNN